MSLLLAAAVRQTRRLPEALVVGQPHRPDRRRYLAAIRELHRLPEFDPARQLRHDVEVPDDPLHRAYYIVSVTQGHLDAGEFGEPTRSPIAVALREVLGWRTLAHGWLISMGLGGYESPIERHFSDDLRRWERRGLAGEDVEPIDLYVPVDRMRPIRIAERR